VLNPVLLNLLALYCRAIANTENYKKPIPKTSGSTGIHIYIPLAVRYNYDQSQMFAKSLLRLFKNKFPAIPLTFYKTGRRP
jgi:DNA primase